MLRKLRLDIGDYVILKINYGDGFVLGRVGEISQNEKEKWKEWGIYGYIIYWTGSDIPSNSGWGITDITAGRLTYIKDPKVIKTLYGRKDI